MAQINLDHGYYIEIDDAARSYDLKQRYEGKTRDGGDRDGVRTVGYFGSMPAALKRFVEVNRTLELGDAPVSLSDAIEAFKKADKKIEQLLAGLEVRIEDS